MTTTLFPTWTLGALNLTSYPFAVEFDGDHGAPETVSELVASMLGDGDLVRQTRHGNREISIVVQVEGPSLGVLAENEATLRAECSKERNELVFQPGDVDSPASVFEVLLVAMRQPRDDVQEQHLVRRWELTLTCAPFARSVDLTTVEAIAVDPGEAATALVDACNSTTGWAAQSGDSLVVATGAVRTSLPDPNPSHSLLGLTRSTAVDMSSHAYLTVTWQAYTAVGNTPNPSVAVAQLWANGVQVREEARIRVTVPGASGAWYKSWYAPGALGIGFSMYLPVSSHPDTFGTLAVAEVEKTNVWPGVSPRQTTRTVDVGGTERTPASLHAYTDAGFLGRTIVHTTPATEYGYSPDLTRWNYSGNTTAPNLDTTYITGSWEALQPSPLVARLPASALPRGDYILMAAMKSTVPGEQAISYAVKSVFAGSVVVGNVTGSTYYAFPEADKMELVPIAAVSAPVVRSEGEALLIEVHLSNPASHVTSLFVEEWWLFADGPDSALSIVGTDSGDMWLESADVTSPVPRVWVGDPDARFHPSTRLLAQGTHAFRPGRMQVTAISDSNDYLEVELSYYKRWHSNAAE